MSLHVAAKHLASKGRDGDTELVHMTKGEIRGLQGLALAHGGSLSINPDTGLVEASFLKRILPMVAGAGLMMIPGVNALAAAGMVGGFETMRTGDIGKGLMAGLGAYGGAGLAQGLSTAGASAAGDIGVNATSTGLQNTGANALRESAGAALSTPMPGVSNAAGEALRAGAQAPVTLGNMGAGFNQITSSPGALGSFAKDNIMNIGASAAPALGDALTPKGPEVPGMPEEDPRYAGSPYRYNLASGFQGSTPTRPNPYYRPTGLGYAEGGDVKKKEPAASQPRAEFSQNLAAGLSGQERPKTQSLPYEIGAKFRGFLNEEGQDRLANYFKGINSAPTAVSGDIPEGYVLDRRTGQLVPASSYGTQGLGYAEGGDVMMAAGGSYEDEPMGDAPGMAAGGIAGYRSGGLKMGEGIARDTDTDTASLNAFEAAKKRMSKVNKAANMPKNYAAKMPEVRGLGELAMAQGGLGGYSDGGRMLKGPGDGMSDDIPAVIGKRQPARLADGEFVVPADVVSHLGNGSTDAGARKLYSMMDKVRTARTGKKKQAPAVKTDKFMPA
jgi:hypothetical protein